MCKGNKYQLRIYVTRDGQRPFERWLYSLNDLKVRAKIRARLERAEDGNLGNWRPVGSGVMEMKIAYGAGYRVYFGFDGPALILLLYGGEKQTQMKDVKRAKVYWVDYHQRRD